MDRWTECCQRIAVEHGLPALHAGPPGCEGWEAWCQEANKEMRDRVAAAQQRVNNAQARQLNLKDYATLCHDWSRCVRQGMLAFIASKPKANDWLPSDGLPTTSKTLFFDLETQRSANDVGGWDKASDMKLSFGGVFHLEEREIRIYGPNQAKLLIKDLCSADAVVGFNHLKFDYEVLRGYEPSAPFLDRNNFDIMVDCQCYLHQRPSLARLAGPTTGAEKLGSGLDALDWWKEGRHAQIIRYLVQDVRVTYEVFAHGCQDGFVTWQNPRTKDGKVTRIPTDHWPTMQQHSNWLGQVHFNGDVTCPINRKRKKSRFTTPGGRE